MTKSEKIIDIIQDTDKNFAPYYDVLPNLIRANNYKRGIEIGVFCGGHAKKLLETNIDLLIGIDPYKNYNPGMPRLDDQADFDLLCDVVGIKLMDYMEAGRYNLMRMTSDEAYKILYKTEYYFDFIFIDGLHTYDQLKKDLDNYCQIIKHGGIIACHDYNHGTFPDLTIAIDEFAAKHNKKLVIGPLHLVYMHW